MEAKDTVMIKSGHCNVYCHQEQAELSFKAGIKEVVDRLDVFENELGFCEISNHIPYQELKEWGVSPTNKGEKNG